MFVQHSLSLISVSSDKMFFQLVGGHLSRGSFISFRKKRGGQIAFLAHAVFQAPLALKNPYVKETYFGVTFWFPSVIAKYFNEDLILVTLGLTW